MCRLHLRLVQCRLHERKNRIRIGQAILLAYHKERPLPLDQPIYMHVQPRICATTWMRNVECEGRPFMFFHDWWTFVLSDFRIRMDTNN